MDCLRNKTDGSENGVRNKSIWGVLLGLKDVVVEDVAVEEGSGQVVVHIRVAAKTAGRCGRCLRRSPRYDRGSGRRRWRHLDAGC